MNYAPFIQVFLLFLPSLINLCIVCAIWYVQYLEYIEIIVTEYLYGYRIPIYVFAFGPLGMKFFIRTLFRLTYV